jgi:predicted phosphohydrolase
MDVFGPLWHDHARQIANNWCRLVGPRDVVLVAGDISWALRLEDALADLEWLATLPGEKVIVRGNHDYWWSSLGKLNALGLSGLHFIQNNHCRFGSLAVAGSRLWDFPGISWPAGVVPGLEPAGESPRLSPEEDDEKIRRREVERLTLSLRSLPPDASLRVVMTHYPPLGEDGEPTPLTDLINRFQPNFCVFGHIHGQNQSGQPRPGEDRVLGKTRYCLTSTDHLGHTPLFLGDITPG